jgi:hypothetical protein
MMKLPRPRGQSEGQFSKRKNKRVRFRFPVTVDVPEHGGRVKTVKAHTLVVSHAGATLDVEEPLPIDTGIQVTPPFGGAILAEVTDCWPDRPSGRHRISIRLIDPTSWTSPDRLSTTTNLSHESLFLSPRAWQMLADYAAYLSEREGYEISSATSAERIIEDVFLSDAKFQNWFAAQIMDDLEAWEEESVLRTE